MNELVFPVLVGVIIGFFPAVAWCYFNWHKKYVNVTNLFNSEMRSKTESINLYIEDNETLKEDQGKLVEKIKSLEYKLSQPVPTDSFVSEKLQKLIEELSHTNNQFNASLCRQITETIDPFTNLMSTLNYMMNDIVFIKEGMSSVEKKGFFSKFFRSKDSKNA